MTASGAMPVAGVIGWPVSHSLSPRLHGYWLAHYGIAGAYVPLAVRPEAIAAAVAGLRALGFAGANVTVPHKRAVMAHLDRVDAAAERIGAVNTVVAGADGALEGRNSDGYGFREALRAAVPNFDVGAGPAVVLGAGGAARAIVVALVDAGVPAVRLVNRTVAKAEQLAAAAGGPVEAWPWERRAEALDGAALLVNATALGMAGQPPLDLDLAALPASAVVDDIVYTPLETPLLAAARGRGHRVVDGLAMLLHQARPAFAAFFGRDPEVTQALREHVLGGG